MFTIFTLIDRSPDQYLTLLREELERARIAIINLTADLAPRFKPGAFGELAHNPPSEKTRLSSVLTFVLEFLDKVLPDQSEIRVESTADGEVPISQQTLAKLLGLLLIHSSDYAGSQGEINLITSFSGDRKQLLLVIAAQGSYIPPIVAGDMRLESITPQVAQHGEELPYILERARSLATANNIALEYREPKEGTLKLRIRLPLLAEEEPPNDNRKDNG